MLKFVAILLVITTSFCYEDDYYDTEKPIKISQSYYLIPNQDDDRSMDQITRVRRLTFEVFYNSLTNPLIEPYLITSVINPALRQISNIFRVKYNPSEVIQYTRHCINNTYEFVEHNNKTIAVCSFGCESDDMVSESLKKVCFSKAQNGSIRMDGNNGRIVKHTDIVISLNWRNCMNGDALAGSDGLQLSMFNDRPVVGILVLCRNNWRLLQTYQEKIKVIQHEVFHIMGFTPAAFAFFRKEDGSPRTERNKIGLPALGLYNDLNKMFLRPSNNTIAFVTTTEQTPGGVFHRTVPYLVTENLRDLARRYYNCQELIGAPLEDLAKLGSYAAHFDGRIINNEIMAPKSSSKMIISNFTLTLFLDSGWYIPNFNEAEPFEYGRNLGCDFVLKNCYEYMILKKQKNQSTFPYCDKCFVTDPTNKQGHEACALYYKPPNAHMKDRYLYAEDKNLISTNEFADFCPVYKSQYYGEKENASWCRDKTVYKDCSVNVPDEDWLWDDCTEQYNVTQDDLRCLEYQCSIDYGMLVKVNGDLFQCRPNMTISIESLKDKMILLGDFICPPCDKYCKTMCSSDLKIYSKSKNSKEIYCNKADPRHNFNIPQIIGYIMLLLFLSYY